MKRNACFFTFLLLTLVLPLAGGEKKVLVWLLDGARAEGMIRAQAPVWSMLVSEKWSPGYHTAWSLHGITALDAPCAAEPNHVTAATGLTAKRHGITANGRLENYSGPALPTFMELLARKNPAFHSAVTVGFLPDIALHPAHGRWHCISCQDPDVNWTERNLYYLCDMLAWSDAPDAFFVLDNDVNIYRQKGDSTPDEELAQNQLQLAMERFGKVLEAIRKRPDFVQENWLVILSSDGGKGKTFDSRDAQSPAIPMLILGKHIPSGELTGTPSLANIAPWCLQHFGADELLPQLDGKAELRTSLAQ